MKKLMLWGYKHLDYTLISFYHSYFYIIWTFLFKHNNNNNHNKPSVSTLTSHGHLTNQTICGVFAYRHNVSQVTWWYLPHPFLSGEGETPHPASSPSGGEMWCGWGSCRYDGLWLVLSINSSLPSCAAVTLSPPRWLWRSSPHRSLWRRGRRRRDVAGEKNDSQKYTIII